MGLAGYGTPRHLQFITPFVKFGEDYVAIDNRSLWHALNDVMSKAPGFQERADLAASFQAMLESILLHYAGILHRMTGLTKLCIAGGVGLNCVANARILKDSPFQEVFVFPGTGDNGVSCGAALYGSHAILGEPRGSQLRSAYFGRSYSEHEIRRALSGRGDEFSIVELPDHEMASTVASLLNEGQVVMWYQGGAEFGPRALGHRSFLASPQKVETKDYINSRIKYREMFRPLAPIVLEEHVNTYFDLDCPSPFMLFSPQSREITKQVAPGIVHCDGSARVQTLADDQNAKLCQLIRAFECLSGVPILLNTSLNLKDVPIVETPQDALEVFETSEVRHLVLEGYLVTKRS